MSLVTQRPLKILGLGLNAAPEVFGVGRTTAATLAWLAARGHDLRMIAAPPYYPQWRISDGWRGWFYTKDVQDGVPHLRAPLYVPKIPTGAKRALHLASFAASAGPAALVSALTFRPDIMLSFAPTLTSAGFAWAAARLSGAKAWLHILDFEVDAAFDLGLLHNKALRRGLLAYEGWALARFDKVSTLSAPMLDRLAAKGVAEDRRVLFPNWTDLAAITPLTAPSPYRRELGFEDKDFVALYSGNLGEKQGLESLVEVAKCVQDHPNIKVVVCGDGAARARMAQAARGLSNFHLLDVQPQARLNDFLGLADVHLLPQRADAADLVMPSKLGVCLASGRAVIAGALPGTALEQGVGPAGLIVPPGDAAAMAAALVDLAAHRERCHGMGAMARSKAEREWNQDLILGRFEDQLYALRGV